MPRLTKRLDFKLHHYQPWEDLLLLKSMGNTGSSRPKIPGILKTEKFIAGEECASSEAR